MGRHVQKISFTLETCRFALEQARLEPPSAERDRMIPILEGIECAMSNNPDLTAEIQFVFEPESENHG